MSRDFARACLIPILMVVFHMTRKENSECHVMRVKSSLRGTLGLEDWVPATNMGASTLLLTVDRRGEESLSGRLLQAGNAK